jgi:hypothetical protein
MPGFNVPGPDLGPPPFSATFCHQRRLRRDADAAATTIVDPVSDGVSDSSDLSLSSGTMPASIWVLRIASMSAKSLFGSS